MSVTGLRMAATAVLAALALGAGAANAADKTKVGFVYVGPIGDHGWSYQHHQGLLAVKKAFGDKVSTTHVEKVSEGPDAERVIRQLAQQGHKIIFTTSFSCCWRAVKAVVRLILRRLKRAYCLMPTEKLIRSFRYSARMPIV